MSLSNLARHGQEALKVMANRYGSQEGFTKDNIWFDWGNKEEHTVRLVGDFKWIRTHWIGESKFGKDIAILNPSAFKDKRIPMNIACSNWDAESETEDPFKGCPVCRLAKNADEMLKRHGKEMEEADREIIKAIRRKCSPKNTYLFKCIDRDNPYVDDAKSRKGFKIIKMPYELLNAIIELSKKFGETNITSPDEGIDLSIKRSKGENGGPMKYTVLPVMTGMNVKPTPLTEEERNYHDIELLKFTGKEIDKDAFEEDLVDENNVRMIYENSVGESNGDAPF